jgi:predicted RNA binding protein YcfA (HicA-like mRNA interferase family)
MIVLGMVILHTISHITVENWGYGMDSRTILKLIKADGWYEVGKKGSHVQLKHPTKPGKVTVAHPEKDLPIGTVKSIQQQSGVKLR